MANFIDCDTESVDLIDSGTKVNHPVNIDAVTSIEKDEYQDMGETTYQIVFNGTCREVWRYTSEEARDKQYNEIKK
jgi:hypothetical protein